MFTAGKFEHGGGAAVRNVLVAGVMCGAVFSCAVAATDAVKPAVLACASGDVAPPSDFMWRSWSLLARKSSRSGQKRAPRKSRRCGSARRKMPRRPNSRLHPKGARRSSQPIHPI